MAHPPAVTSASAHAAERQKLDGMDGGRDHPRKDGNNTMYKFHWSEDFLKNGLKTLQHYFDDPDSTNPYDNDYVGAARVGDVCFDLVVRDRRNEEEFPEDAGLDHNGRQPIYFDFDVYVGGIDDGYGYSDRNPETPKYPYTNGYFAGGDIGCESYLEDYLGLSLDELLEMAESSMTEFLSDPQNRAAYEAANRPFHFW